MTTTAVRFGFASIVGTIGVAVALVATPVPIDIQSFLIEGKAALAHSSKSKSPAGTSSTKSPPHAQPAVPGEGRMDKAMRTMQNVMGQAAEDFAEAWSNAEPADAKGTLVANPMADR